MSTNKVALLDIDKPRPQAIANALVEGAVGHAAVLKAFPAVRADEEGEMPELVVALRDASSRVNAGDLKAVEATLVQQAVALDSLFVNLASRAAGADTMPRLETYLRLALKAQQQSRATLETLAEIKNPRPVVVAKQANIAQQQVVTNPGSTVGGAARLEGGDGFFAGGTPSMTPSMVSLSKTATNGGCSSGDARGRGRAENANLARRTNGLDT